MSAWDLPRIQNRIVEVAKEHGVNPNLMLRMANQESRFNPTAVSPVGAKGIFQLMPGTAKEQGVNDPFDPEQSIRGGISYYAKMLKANNGDERLALASYNAGLGNVRKYGNTIPPFKETQDYVNKIYDSWDGRPARIPESGAVKPNPIPQKPAVQPTPQAQVVPQNVVEVAQASAAPVLPSSNGLAASLVNERQTIVDKKALQDAYLSGKEAKEEKVQYTSPISADGLAKSLSYMKDFSEYATPTSIGKAKGNSRLKFN